MVPMDLSGDVDEQSSTATRKLRKRATKFDTLVRRQRITKELNDRRQKRKLKRQQRKTEGQPQPQIAEVQQLENQQRETEGEPQLQITEVELLEKQREERYQQQLEHEDVVRRRQTLLVLQEEVARRMKPFVLNLMRRPQPLSNYTMDLTDTPERMSEDTLDSVLKVFGALERKLGQDDKLIHAMIHYMYQLCIRNGHGTSVEHFTDYMTRNIGECFRKYNVNAVRIFEVEIKRPDGQGSLKTDYCYSKIWGSNFPPPGCRGFTLVVDED